jgi:hypothetical protein
MRFIVILLSLYATASYADQAGKDLATMCRDFHPTPSNPLPRSCPRQ